LGVLENLIYKQFKTKKMKTVAINLAIMLIIFSLSSMAIGQMTNAIIGFGFAGIIFAILAKN
jgi:hypothetical protein